MIEVVLCCYNPCFMLLTYVLLDFIYSKNEHRTPIKDTIKKSVNITNMQSPRRGRPSKKRKLLQQINEGSKKVKKHHSHLHINGSSVQQRPTILSQQNTELDVRILFIIT